MLAARTCSAGGGQGVCLRFFGFFLMERCSRAWILLEVVVSNFSNSFCRHWVCFKEVRRRRKKALITTCSGEGCCLVSLASNNGCVSIGLTLAVSCCLLGVEWVYEHCEYRHLLAANNLHGFGCRRPHFVVHSSLQQTIFRWEKGHRPFRNWLQCPV